MASGVQYSMLLAWNVRGSASDGSGAVVGALQPVFGVGFDPRAQRYDGDPSRCAVTGRWQLAATQHLVDGRAAVAQQARCFDHVDLEGFKRRE
jgi:hypothetical protein